MMDIGNRDSYKRKLASNSMSRLSTKGPKPKIAYAAGGVDSKLWVLFGGYNGATETQEIYKFDFGETHFFLNVKSIQRE